VLPQYLFDTFFFQTQNCTACHYIVAVNLIDIHYGNARVLDEKLLIPCLKLAKRCLLPNIVYSYVYLTFNLVNVMMEHRNKDR